MWLQEPTVQQETTNEGLGYGLHFLTKDESGQENPFAICSVSNFQSFFFYLKTLATVNKPLTVLTPEVITEIDGEKVNFSKEFIESNILEVLEISRFNPLLQILLGSSYWQNKDCFNSVLNIQGGQIRQVISKTYLTPGEEGDSTPSTLDKTPVIGLSNTGLLICRDLHFAAGGPPNSPFPHPRMIPPDCETLLVSSCWGSGSRVPRKSIASRALVQSGELTLDAYSNGLFLTNLRMSIGDTFRSYGSIKRIVICDRAQVERGQDLEDTITSTIPFTKVFLRNN